MEEEFLDKVKQNEGLIFKLIRIYTNELDEQKDLYQEIIYQLWRSYSTFRGEAKMSTWIYKIALNTALIHIKLKKKHSNIFNFENINLPIEDSSEFTEEEKLNEMNSYIKPLNDTEKAIIFLVLEGKNYDEIATITGFSKSNVGTKINRIKQQLKNKASK